MRLLLYLLSPLLALLLAGTLPAQPILVDTDAGQDDLMALAFLLARCPEEIRGIVVTHGVAHVGPGVWNIRRLLTLAGHPEIPVIPGERAPLSSNRTFPRRWRQAADRLPGVRLPRPEKAHPGRGTPGKPETGHEFLTRSLGPRGSPHRLLVLGPLTTLARALGEEPRLVENLTQIVLMGGAVRVPGNVEDRPGFLSPSRTAEWNLFVDPPATRAVFQAPIPLLLVPLDATREVPVDRDFAAVYQRPEPPPLARFMRQLLGTLEGFLESGNYFAWDALAAVALVHPEVLETRPLPIRVELEPPHEGRTHEVRSGAPHSREIEVALGADAQAFDRHFHRALWSKP